MCGIVGIHDESPVAASIYESLIHLQHRGADAAGIATCLNGMFRVTRGAGYVREAFTEGQVGALTGTMGIGHTRYTTAGSSSDMQNAQPFFANAPYGVALAHNGNLTNVADLRAMLQSKASFHCNSESDTEVLLGVFVSALAAGSATGTFLEQYATAVERVFADVKGAYSVIGMIAGKGLFAFRDPHGIRPLVYGTRDIGNGRSAVIVASENTMFAPLGYTYGGDILPGEAFFVDADGKIHRKRLRQEPLTPCVFEYVYFARPDALLNQISVYRARQRMGENLGKAWRAAHPNVHVDVVVPVPFTSNPIALEMAQELGIKYSEGLYKNNYVGRTFLMPGAGTRAKAVRRKLSPQTLELKDKAVLLVDDSIVRGTTSREIVSMVRAAGATKVYLASACPPVKYPDYYGIDIPTAGELIASHMSEEEIREFVGADILLYQTIPDLVEAVTRHGNHAIARLSMPYLDGWYVTGDITDEKVNAIAHERSRERTAS